MLFKEFFAESELARALVPDKIFAAPTICE